MSRNPTGLAENGSMSLLSPTFQVNLRNLSGSLVLKDINDMFQGAGIAHGTAPEPAPSGQRRRRAMEYWVSINWDSAADTQKVLTAVTIALTSSSVSTEDKEKLRVICDDEGLRFDGKRVVLGGLTGAGIKNLIFASDGYKPEIVLKDATTNDIQIVKNADSCLVYDRPIGPDGLLWSDLKKWWIETHSATTDSKTAGTELANRLERSLGDNEPEKLLLRRYLTTVRDLIGLDQLPAIIPQVYLHYDPYTFRQRGGPGPLERQRMDFLLLLRGNHKIVLEIDGKQHYSEEVSGRHIASPSLYAKMMAEDRRLRLAGYELYRFGGQEFVNQTTAAAMLDDFFKQLLGRCGYTVQ